MNNKTGVLINVNISVLKTKETGFSETFVKPIKINGLKYIGALILVFCVTFKRIVRALTQMRRNISTTLRSIQETYSGNYPLSNSPAASHSMLRHCYGAIESAGTKFNCNLMKRAFH